MTFMEYSFKIPSLSSFNPLTFPQEDLVYMTGNVEDRQFNILRKAK